MNIIYIVSNKDWNSSERYVLDLAKGMKALGHKVTVVCRNNDEIRQVYKKAGIDTVTAPLLGAMDIISPVKVSRLLREKPDSAAIIHVQDFSDAVTASRARTLSDNKKTRIVLTRHITSPGKKGAAATAIYNDTDAIVFPTQRSKERFVSGDPGVESMKLFVVKPSTNRTDTDTSVQPVRDAEVFTVLFAGRITPTKGVDTLIKAVSQIKELPVRVIVAGQGEGPVVMPVIKEARADGIADRIDWKGAVAVPDSLFAAADIAVIPDKIPAVYDWMLSAASTFSLPMIASDHAEHREMLPESTIYFEAGNPDDLARAIREAYHCRNANRIVPDPNAFDTYMATMQTLYSNLLNR